MPLPCTPGAARRAGFAIARAEPGLTAAEPGLTAARARSPGAQPGLTAARARSPLTPRVRVVQGSEYRVRSDLEEKEPNMQEKDTFEKAGIFSP